MKNSINKKGIIILIAIIIFVIIGLTISININNKRYEIKLEKIGKSDVKYYVLMQDEKCGVIDANGNVVVKPIYESLQIPNPTLDIFICTNDVKNNDNWKAINSSNQPILTEYDSVQAISIKQITSFVPFEKTVLKYRSGKLYGIMDFSGKKITEPIYEEISNLDFKEGNLKVKKDGLYGIINIKGTTILKTEYDNIMSDGYYSENTQYLKAGFILRTKTDDGYRFGYANERGKIVLEPIYNEVNRITEVEDDKTVYLIPSSNGKYGLVKNGKQILENEYQEINYDKTNNIIIAQKGTVQGVFSMEGKNIIPLDYNSIIIGGDYINAIKGDKKVIFDKNGNEIKTDISSHNQVSKDYSIVIDKEDGSYNILDKNNNKLLKESYVYIDYYKDNYFIVTKNSLTGIIDSLGKIIIPIQYATIQKIDKTELLKVTETTKNKIDIIGADLKIKDGLENAVLEKNEKYIKIYSNSDVKYFDISGKEIEYKDIENNNSLYAKKQNDKWGFVDSNGNTVVQFIYEMVTEQNGNVAGIKQNGKWGIVDSTGKIILEPKYELNDIGNNKKFLNIYYEIANNIGVPMYCGD